jgi:hypothetical protein
MLVVPTRGEDEGGRARSAVQIFVRAADGQIDAGRIERNRQRADAVAEVPDDEGARCMRLAGKACHVAHHAGAIVDMVDQHDGRIAIDQRSEIGARWGELQRHAGVRPGNAFGDVEVGREAVGLGQDHRAVGSQRKSRMERLVNVDGRCVGHHRFARLGADQPADAIAHRVGEREPAGGVPAADQAFGPFLPRRLLEFGEHRLGGRAQRIAVEVDHAFGQDEALAHGAQRVGGIECRYRGEVERHGGAYFIQGGSGSFFSRRKTGLKSFD